MILLTVGTQLPFDRLVRTVDAWCATSGRADVVGQIGDPGVRGYRPKHFRWSAFVPPREIDSLMSDAELIVAHAGMGSIISALQHAKPIVIMPRRAALGEHRNDHQQATAVRFADRPGIFVAPDEHEFSDVVDRAISNERHCSALSAFAQPNLIRSIRRYIVTGMPKDSLAVDVLDDIGQELT